jgi:hypothetical protein
MHFGAAGLSRNDPCIDPTRKQDLKKAEVLSYFQGTIVLQHDTSGPDAEGTGDRGRNTR